MEETKKELDLSTVHELVAKAKTKYEEMRMEKGLIRDADTILLDCLENQDETEATGIFEELVSLYEKAADKEDFAELFELLVGISFPTYLARTVTRSGPVQQ